MRSLSIALSLFLLCGSSPLAAQVMRSSKPAVTRKSTADVSRRIFAPYVDMSKPENDLVAMNAASGVRYFTLAFVLAGNGCAPAWGGNVPIATEAKFSASIYHLRTAGGDVIVAFGGYDGTELAMACPDAKSLQAAYQSVVTKYRLTMLDFDIEHLAIEDATSIDRRSQALSALAAANPGLDIAFTLPVHLDGLSDNAIAVLKSAVRYKVPISTVNLMTMDYGEPVAAGKMAPTAIRISVQASRQLETLGLRAALGITPMIGMNDTPHEIFTPADARALLSYARTHGQIKRLAMWSMGRDNGGCPGKVSPACSGIAQKKWEFSRIFLSF
jgi:hypothetical protein